MDKDLGKVKRQRKEQETENLVREKGPGLRRERIRERKNKR